MFIIIHRKMRKTTDNVWVGVGPRDEYSSTIEEAITHLKKLVSALPERVEIVINKNGLTIWRQQDMGACYTITYSSVGMSEVFRLHAVLAEYKLEKLES